MNTIIDVLVFGTFGTPNGFTQRSFLKNTYKTFDLNANAIVLFPKTKLYSIRRELYKGSNLVSYSIYTFAKEMYSERGGTFIGSSILFFDEIPHEPIILNCLNELHQDLISNQINIIDDVIQVSHSNKLKVKEPENFQELKSSVKQIEDWDFTPVSNKNLVVYTKVDSASLQELLKKSVDLLNIYETVYFTASAEIAKFVKQRGLFKFVEVDGFEKELQHLDEEKKLKIQRLILEFEKQRKDLEEDRKVVIANYKLQIESNEKLHLENNRLIEQSKKGLDALDKTYDNFELTLDDSIKQLNLGKKPSEIKQSQDKKRIAFIDSINQRSSLDFASLSFTSTGKTGLKTSSSSQGIDFEQNQYCNGYFENDSRNEKSNSFKLGFFFLLFLWVITIIYFLFFIPNYEPEIANQYYEIQKPVIREIDTLTKSLIELNPIPNSKLNEKGYKLISKKIQMGMKVGEVVRIIFANNPNDIKATYSNESEAYSMLIVKLNKDCFEEKNGIIYFKGDTLKLIPSYVR